MMLNIQRFLPGHRVVERTPTGPPPSMPYDKNQSNFKAEVLHNQYIQPSIPDILVIIPFFNPCNSVRIVQNLFFVKNKLELADIPYVIVHCLFPDSVRIMKESKKYITVQSTSYAFLKENLANYIIKHTYFVKKYNKFLIHDGDVVFDNKCWYDELSKSLENADIVQPYIAYKSLDSNFVDVLSEGYGVFAKYMTEHSTYGHPGYAISFTRDYFNCHGYPEEAVIGGGDTLICSLALNMRLFEKHHNKVHLGYLYDKYHKGTQIITNYISGTIYHLYHNVTNNRQYSTRYMILNKYIDNQTTSFNNIDDLFTRTKEGIIEWKPIIRDQVNNDMLNYFSSRQDDEIAI
jgi:hypothetical protein